ncbi:MAG: hemerythrin domain-containing protein [Nitrospirota bacterium]
MNELNSNYLNDLKNDHKTLGRLLEDIKGLVQTNDIQGIATRMDSLRNGLLAHLKKEDDKIYMDLLTIAKEKNIELVTITINTFSTAMKGIATRVLKFFDKYSKREEIAKLSSELYNDFPLVYEDLLKRVDREEKVLYPMYEKYCC